MNDSGGTIETRRTIVLDVWALVAIVILSALPYLAHVGFYSDDWAILSSTSDSSGQGMMTSIIANFPGRPVQGLYLLLLLKAFGLSPIGYQVVNTLVLSVSIPLFYLLMVRLRLGRLESFAAALIFAMLPQLSTVRVWYSAFQIPLSLALALASMHCQLSFARSAKWFWLAGAIVSAVLSIGAYEIFAPLITGFAAGLALERWRTTGWGRPQLLAIGCVCILLLSALLYKAGFSERTGPLTDMHRYLAGLHQLVRLDYDWRFDSGLNIVATPEAYFRAPIQGLWPGATYLATGRGEVIFILSGLAIAILAASRMTKASATGFEPKRSLALGLVTFVLGNATFLIVPAVVFTSTGVDNRVQVAAALGVAMIFAAILAYAARSFGAQRGPRIFAVCAVTLVSLAFSRIAMIEEYWGEAADRQASILNAARSDLANLPARSTVILDGVCSYVGPGIVFEANWDVGPALSLGLHRPISGDVVSNRMSLNRGGLATSIYKEPSFYRFGPTLFAYDPIRHRVVNLDSAASARSYFRSRPPLRCPEGYVARGVAV